MITFIVMVISVIAFIYGIIMLLLGNIKAKGLLRLLPNEKVESFRFGTGYNNIKICRYIMREDNLDTEEIIEKKKAIRPIIKKFYLSISIFFGCLVILILIDIFK
ncbi:MAG: hypothetical protein ACMUJM_19300 [bacterium]